MWCPVIKKVVMVMGKTVEAHLNRQLCVKSHNNGTLINYEIIKRK